MIRPRFFAPVAAWVLLPAAAGAQDAPRMPEYHVKAQYLGTLCDYAQWPGANGVGDKSQPFRIGILGESPFQDFLGTIWSTKKIQGHKVAVRVSSRVMDLLDSNVIFICESESDRLTEILRAIRGKPILTIGDTTEYANRGVMVNLYMQQKQVRFEININALRASGMSISPQVLNLARIVK